jgi:hypothetical protein
MKFIESTLSSFAMSCTSSPRVTRNPSRTYHHLYLEDNLYTCSCFLSFFLSFFLRSNLLGSKAPYLRRGTLNSPNRINTRPQIFERAIATFLGEPNKRSEKISRRANGCVLIPVSLCGSYCLIWVPYQGESLLSEFTVKPTSIYLRILYVLENFRY